MPRTTPPVTGRFRPVGEPPVGSRTLANRIVSCGKSNTGASTVCCGEPASIFHCVSGVRVRSVPGPTGSTSVRHDGHGIRELRGSPQVAPLRASVRGAIAAGLFGDLREPAGGSPTDKFGVSNIRISPTGKRARYPFCRVNRQSRLADPARSGQSHQSCLGGQEHCRDFFDLALTANEGRGQCRQRGESLPGRHWRLGVGAGVMRLRELRTQVRPNSVCYLISI